MACFHLPGVVCDNCRLTHAGAWPQPATGMWTNLVHTCKACGASWYAPRDEPGEDG